MKNVIFILSMFLVGCTPSCQKGTGVIVGKLVDAEFSGLVFKSCEIIIQKGEGSSAMDQSSSFDQSVCTKASGMLGKQVKVQYTSYNFPGQQVETGYIITSLEEVK